MHLAFRSESILPKICWRTRKSGPSRYGYRPKGRDEVSTALPYLRSGHGVGGVCVW
jgi:hypothetical protein